MKPTMLFVRDFHHLTGGHLKFGHYLAHAAQSDLVEPVLYLTPGSLPAAATPFSSTGADIVPAIAPADSYFTAGFDWDILDAAGIDMTGKPVINFVQGTWHADPSNPRHAYLSRPATRICASPDIAEALRACGRVNGEILTIPYGVDLLGPDAPAPRPIRGRLFIGGLKNRDMAAELAARLGHRFDVDLAIDLIPRAEYLERLAQASLCVLLPLPVEGFFLPAIEAMALGVPVVIPDCIGNRSFCLHEESCLMPPYMTDALVAAVFRLDADRLLAHRLRAGGRAMASRQSLASERRSFLSVLARCLEERG